MDEAEDFGTGNELTGFEQVCLVGEGGYSRVYAAIDPLMGRKVAIKVLKTEALDDLASRRFQVEVRSLAGLKHPNIVEVYKLSTGLSGTPYMVMEYLEGETLRDYLNKHGSLQDSEFRLFFQSLLAALECAHQQNIIHRDIKPENVFLINSDAEAAAGVELPVTVKLLDFGIARVLSSTETQSLTRTGALIGSPRYLSPEQCRNSDVDCRSDLYSLACLMYESLEGRALFDGNSAAEIMYKHLHEPVATPVNTSAGISKPMQKVLSKALATAPDERFQSASAFLEALSGVNEIKIAGAGVKRTKGKSVYIALAILGSMLGLAFGLKQVFSDWKESPSDVQIHDARKRIARTLLSKYTEARDAKLDNHVLIELLQKAIKQAEAEKSLDLQIEAHFNLGRQYDVLAKHDLALSEYKKAERLAHLLNPTHEYRALTKLCIAREFIVQGKLEEAHRLAQEFVHSGDELEISMNEWSKAESRLILAQVLYLQGKVKQADSVLQEQWKRYLNFPKDLVKGDISIMYQALKLQSERGDKDLLRKNMSDYGRLVSRTDASTGDFEKTCMQAIKLGHKLGMNSQAQEIEKMADKARHRSGKPQNSEADNKPGGELHGILQNVTQ